MAALRLLTRSRLSLSLPPLPPSVSRRALSLLLSLSLFPRGWRSTAGCQLPALRRSRGVRPHARETRRLSRTGEDPGTVVVVAQRKFRGAGPHVPGVREASGSEREQARHTPGGGGQGRGISRVAAGDGEGQQDCAVPPGEKSREERRGVDPYLVRLLTDKTW